MTRWLLFAVPAVAVLGAGVWYWAEHRRPKIEFRTVKVQRGDLVVTVSATGTLEPPALVDVGAQVQGQIIELGKDPKSRTGHIDWNSEVEKGTVLARIDDSLYQATAAAARASLKKAEADIPGLVSRKADREENWRRASDLVLKDADSVQQYERIKADYDVAVANLAMGRAAIQQAEADLKHAEANVRYCTIVSPTKGVVIDRRVNVGQTVVSSFNAPSLFLIAQDLGDLQVWASINEADVGRIFPNQKVRFTVAAYPAEVFQGKVARRGLRRNASMTQNVVTYTVAVDIEKPAGAKSDETSAKKGPAPASKLQPYMTANMFFEVARKDKVLKVPNAALRWRPDLEQVAPAHRAAFLRSEHPVQDEDSDGITDGAESNKGTVWVPEGAFVRPVAVQLGLNSGTSSEVVSGDLQEGAEIVVGVAEPGSKAAGGNPFIPHRAN